MKTKLALLLAFLVTHFFTAAWAAEVLIPDAALKAAIWQSLGRPAPVGTLTEEDMLSLTNLNAGGRGVRSLDGIGAARNLTTLELCCNELTSVTLPAGLNSLISLHLENNQLTNLTLPAGLTNLTTLVLEFNQLTNLTLPAELTNLTALNLSFSTATNFTLRDGATINSDFVWEKECSSRRARPDAGAAGGGAFEHWRFSGPWEKHV